MRAKVIIALLLVVSLLFPLASGVSEGNDPINYIQDIVNQFLAEIRPLDDIYAHSVAATSNSIDIETQGILIDETNCSVSLTSEVNSITFFLSDAAKLEQIAGWVVCNIRLYEKDGWTGCKILRKSKNGKTTDVSDKLSEYLLTYASAYEAQPMASLTPRNDKWTHQYEGTVDMLIAWEMLSTYLLGTEYMEELKVAPPGISYMNMGQYYYLLITDYEKSFVITLNSDQTDLALGFAVLYALHTNFYPGEISYYTLEIGEESTDQDIYVHTNEISVDEQKNILTRIVEAISFESGIMDIRIAQ